MTRGRHAAFTFVELCLGLLVTSMVMGGVAAIMTSVSQGWQQGQSTQAMQAQANQVYMRVQKVLSAAKYVGQYNAGSVTDPLATPGSIFFWRGDDYGGVADGSVQTAEMAVIEQDPTTHSLYLYEAIPYAQMSPAQLTRAGAVLHYSDLVNPASPAQFKALDFVARRQALGGPGDLADTGSHLHVNAAQFFVRSLNSTTELPVIEFALSFSRSGEQSVLYESTTLRGPSTQPN